MCVGLPARVLTMKDGMAVVDASGAKREISAQLLEELEPGDYVMVHAGMAIAKIASDDEEETEDLLEDLPELKYSLDHRLPYFNVLNYAQIELIKRQRDGRLDEEDEKLIHITINGIATGLRNSG